MLSFLYFGAVVSLVTNAATAPPVSSRPDAPEYLSFPQGYIPIGDGSTITLHIPRAIDESEWRIYSQWLSLSDAQVRVANEAYDRYRRADWEYRVKHTQPLWERAANMPRAGETATDVRVAEELLSLYRGEESVIPAIERIEERFLAELREVLADPQALELEKIAQQRVRFRAEAFGSAFPGFTFDIDGVLMQMQFSGRDIKPRDSQMMEELLTQWRTSCTALHRTYLQQARDAVYDAAIPTATAFQRMRSGERRTPAIEQLFEKAYDARRPSIKTARRILELNSHYVVAVADQLPADAAQYLVSRFQRETFSWLFPDECDLELLFADMQGLDLTEKQREIIGGTYSDWRDAAGQLMQSILAEHLDWTEKTAVRSGYPRAEYEEYAQKMHNLGERRVQKSKSALESVRQTLTEEQIRVLQTQVVAVERSLDRFAAEMGDSLRDHGGWPGPYD